MRQLRPYVTPPMATIKAEIEQAVNDARKAQEQQANALASTLFGVQQTLTTITDQLQQFAIFKAQLEQVASKAEGQRQQFTTFRSQFEEITSTVAHLTTSLEALQVKYTSHKNKGSNRSDGLRRTKVANLHTVATGSSGRATHLQETGEMNIGRKERAFMFIAEYQRRNEGAEPTLPEIMEAVSCSQGSALTIAVIIGRCKRRKRAKSPQWLGRPTVTTRCREKASSRTPAWLFGHRPCSAFMIACMVSLGTLQRMK